MEFVIFELALVSGVAVVYYFYFRHYIFYNKQIRLINI